MKIMNSFVFSIIIFSALFGGFNITDKIAFAEKVTLQNNTPGNQEDGNINISGKALFGGNVGIKTADPKAELHIGANNNGKARIKLGDETTRTWQILANDKKLKIKDVTAGENRLVINKLGNVGIGTATPSTELEVNGTVKATSFVGNGSGLTGIGSGGISHWDTNGVDIYNINTGNVGIGTTNPDATLEVHRNSCTIEINSDLGHIDLVNTDSTSNNWTRLRFMGALNNESMAQIAVKNVDHSATEDSEIHFSTRGAGSSIKSDMVINNNGNVGIGTTAPSAKFHIKGGPVKVEDVDGGFFAIFTGSQQIGGIGTERNVSGGSNTNLMIFADNTSNTTDGDIMFNTGGLNRMVIDKTSGNIGIGTTNPGCKLDVAGSVCSNGVALSSDVRFKKDITPLKRALEKVNNLVALSIRDLKKAIQK